LRGELFPAVADHGLIQERRRVLAQPECVLIHFGNGTDSALATGQQFSRQHTRLVWRIEKFEVQIVVWVRNSRIQLRCSRHGFLKQTGGHVAILLASNCGQNDGSLANIVHACRVPKLAHVQQPNGPFGFRIGCQPMGKKPIQTPLAKISEILRLARALQFATDDF
jgi:hypothetical protein